MARGRREALVEDDGVTMVDVQGRSDAWLEKRELLREVSVEGRDGLESVSDLLEVAIRELALSPVDESSSDGCCLLGDLRGRVDDPTT